MAASKIDLTLNFVSSICWEILFIRQIRLNCETFPVFKLLLDSVYDISPIILEQNLRIYWRYSKGDFLKINNYMSFCAFLNLMVEPNLYLVMEDAEKSYNDTEKFLKILDLIELQRVKAMERNKYDLRCEAEEIGEEIKRRQESLECIPNLIEAVNNDTDILRFALRKMPMGRCYTADICSGYSIIDCVRKGWPKTKKILAPLPDEVIERKIKKDKTDKKGKEQKEPKAKKDKKRKTKKL